MKEGHQVPLPFDVPEARDAGRVEIGPLSLEVVTPILGGAARCRSIDREDPIRGPSLRGHFRMWWRALLDEVPGLGENDPERLSQTEQALFGGVRGTKPIKSAVRVRVLDVAGLTLDEDDVTWRDPLFYVVWPAASSNRDAQPAPRIKPGLRFGLQVSAPQASAVEMERVLRAWLMFGGCGGRTRRGLGSVAPVDPEARTRWLPRAATVSAVAEHLGVRFGREHGGRATDMPRLHGASLAIGPETKKAEQALENAINWLKEFRQGQPGAGAMGTFDPAYARVRGAHNRPSVSNWPEADKVRRLVRGRWGHAPQHLDDPAWPRAGFGLPIQTQWQTKARNGGSYREPPNYNLEWRSADGARVDRLASPLIVGPMPLANGKYAPFALWLHRAYPKGGRVVAVVNGQDDMGAAPFDKLLGAGDTARFQPLDKGRKEEQGLRLRTAFMGWLRDHKRVPEVAL